MFSAYLYIVVLGFLGILEGIHICTRILHCSIWHSVHKGCFYTGPGSHSSGMDHLWLLEDTHTHILRTGWYTWLQLHMGYSDIRWGPRTEIIFIVKYFYDTHCSLIVLELVSDAHLNGGYAPTFASNIIAIKALQAVSCNLTPVYGSPAYPSWQEQV